MLRVLGVTVEVAPSSSTWRYEIWYTSVVVVDSAFTSDIGGLARSRSAPSVSTSISSTSGDEPRMEVYSPPRLRAPLHSTVDGPGTCQRGREWRTSGHGRGVGEKDVSRSIGSRF